MPSSPYVFDPQHRKAPLCTAHECTLPQENKETPEVRPTTGTGRFLSTVVPSPKDAQLLNPKQYIAPAAVTAHVCWDAHDTATTFVRVDTVRNTAEVTVVPFPSWPYVF